MEPMEQELKCQICMQSFSSPKVLTCFHSFCKQCLLQCQSSDPSAAGYVTCPLCYASTIISPVFGIDGLLNDYGLQSVCEKQNHADAVNAKDGTQKKANGASTNIKEMVPGLTSLSSTPPNADGVHNSSVASNNADVVCVSCTSGDSVKALCSTCGYLCDNCQMAHKFMHCFKGHQVEPLQIKSSSNESIFGSTSVNGKSSCNCLEHPNQSLSFFCFTCNIPICYRCIETEHKNPHEIQPIDVIAGQEIKRLEEMVNKAVGHKAMNESFVDEVQNGLKENHQQAISTIHGICQILLNVVYELRQKVLTDLEAKVGMKQIALNVQKNDSEKMRSRMAQFLEFTRRLLANCSPPEIMLFKPLIESRIESFFKYDANFGSIEKRISELHILPVSHEDCYGAISEIFAQAGFDVDSPSDISISMAEKNPLSSNRGSLTEGFCRTPGRPRSVESPSKNAPPCLELSKQHFVPMDKNTATPPATSAPFNLFADTDAQNNNAKARNESVSVLPNDVDGSSSPVVQYQVFPLRPQVKRQKMIYYCHFGEFGVTQGQFTEPSGVAVNAQGDIVVADTNNHRIQVFDRDGRFKFHFGECGKRDGQLLYPNRVAVNRSTGDFIVTERSPTHQIQVFNAYGQFLHKFGADVLQHPRGICVDHEGRIIVVECKVMRVIIFDSFGNLLHKFSCSRYLDFPNGVCASRNKEILISDNRAHCIKVFSYEGQYLRQIGGEGVTNYPIGVGINSSGDIIVADNHNNFNLTVFDPAGKVITAYESKVKHAQCFDMALIDDGSVVVASKDYRLYLYRFAPPMTAV